MSTPSPPSADPGSTRESFRDAQGDLFDAVGLDARSRFVELPEPAGRTHVIESGHTGTGVPLLFVHGTTEFAAFNAPLMAQFDDVHAIAFDRPGYGLSDPYEYTTATIRRTLVDAVAGVLDELGVERVDLVGHSMGGYAGIRTAIAHPERVRHLVLVGSVPAFPGTSPPVPIRLLTAPVLGALLTRLQTPDEEGVLDFAGIFGERESIQRYPALIRAIMAQQADPRTAAAGRSEFGALISVLGWRRAVRLRTGELRDVRRPTLAVWGEDDPLGRPDAVRDALDVIPDSTLEAVPGGHVPYFAHPERCAELISDAWARPDVE